MVGIPGDVQMRVKLHSSLLVQFRPNEKDKQAVPIMNKVIQVLETLGNLDDLNSEASKPGADWSCIRVFENKSSN